jgi:hypothetical protein
MKIKPYLHFLTGCCHKFILLFSFFEDVSLSSFYLSHGYSLFCGLLLWWWNSYNFLFSCYLVVVMLCITSYSPLLFVPYE